MITAENTIEIDLAAPIAWNILSELENVHRFHPNVESTSIESHNSQGVGAVRVCHMYDGSSVKETVTEWVEGRRFKMDLEGMPAPIKFAVAELSITAKNPRRCAVSIRMDYRVGMGPLGAIMGRVMMKPMMKSMFKKVIKALETHGLTGQWIGKGGTPISAAA